MSIKNLFVFCCIIALLSSCGGNIIHLADVDSRRYEIDYYAASDASIDSIIAPYKQELDAKMNKVIAYSPVSLVKENPILI